MFPLQLLHLAALPIAAITAQTVGQAVTVDLGYSIYQASNNVDESYYNFTNIRYGQAPIGDLRFRPSVFPKAENGTLGDGTNAIMCPQGQAGWTRTAFANLFGANIGQSYARPTLESLNISSIPASTSSESEDCLFLDVMIPKSIFDRRGVSRGAPVIVWIHGGGYVGGGKTLAGSSGNPAGILARSQEDGDPGVIYVGINYRLGLFGWLSGPSYQVDGTANLGLHDQRLALDWVQKYISRFGGDPKRVTVIGESAGGGSIMHQITAFGGRQSKALFQQAIIQSPAIPPTTVNTAQESYQNVLRYASVVTERNITGVSELRALTSEQLYLVNSIAVALSSFGTYPFGPAPDGVFVPKPVGKLLLEGQFDKHVRVMVGQNADEGALFADPFVRNETDFVEYAKSIFPEATQEVINHVTQELYPPSINGTFGYTSQFKRNSQLVSDVVFTCNNRYISMAYEKKGYSYYFAVPPAYHGADISHTFFDGSAGGRTIFGTPVDNTTALAMQRYFTRFAKTGSPNSKTSSLPNFPVYGDVFNTQILNITALGAQIKDPSANERCAWLQRGLFY